MMDKILNLIKHDPGSILNLCKTRKEFLVRNRPGLPIPVKLKPKDFNYCYKLYLEEIKTRENPEDRVEWFEAKDSDGAWDYDIEQSIIDSRRKIKSTGSNRDEKKIKEFAKLRGIPSSMANLYISEIAQSDSPEDERAKNQARLMGLIR